MHEVEPREAKRMCLRAWDMELDSQSKLEPQASFSSDERDIS
jgi:hypothetical protein